MVNAQSQSRRLRSKADVARELGISVETIDKLIACGKLKTVKLDGSMRPKVLQSSIDELMGSEGR
jgi:hypothetical protein